MMRGISPILLKAVVALITGGVAYLITNFANQPTIWSITISTFIGGAILIVQFIMEFEDRLAMLEISLGKHWDEMGSLVSGGFARVNEATQLFSLVEQSAIRTDAVTQLVRNAAEIGSEAPALLHSFARTEVSRLATLLQDLHAGEATYEGEDHEWLLALAQNAETAIDATSTEVDADLWVSEFGRRYLVAQREAVGRGVKIRRVFILDDPGLVNDADVRRLCREQEDLGVEVRTVVKSALRSTERLDPMFDFIVFDHAISYEVTPEQTDDHPVIATTRLVLRQDKVNRRIRRFNDLWEAGTEADQNAPAAS
ncbi:hypothetical protein [Actinacidiphila oryziradicis]|jgi:hypothetical protein|uniref:DUF6879 family protein n=1 Tax=Actinacidiphila oryziradicis TaxID=2571141 RepID=UPI0023F1037D|nr:hypothetical protein [Actinacidiphila oryziradicis]